MAEAIHAAIANSDFQSGFERAKAWGQEYPLAFEPLLAQVQIALSLQRGEEAGVLLRQRLDLYPMSAEVHLSLALLHLHRGEWRAAESSVERASYLDGEDALIHLVGAQIAEQQRDGLSALRRYRSALKGGDRLIRMFLPWVDGLPKDLAVMRRQALERVEQLLRE